MLRTLHQTAAFFFYLLGFTFFVAIFLLKRGVIAEWSAWWMQVADLPLILCALLYAGMSFYESIREPGKHSWQLAVGIAAPLVTLFGLLALFNFWPQ